jgi:hypothetical protein
MGRLVRCDSPADLRNLNISIDELLIARAACVHHGSSMAARKPTILAFTCCPRAPANHERFIFGSRFVSEGSHPAMVGSATLPSLRVSAQATNIHNTDWQDIS